MTGAANKAEAKQIEAIVDNVTKDVAPDETTDIRTGYNSKGGYGGYGGYGRSGQYGGHRVATGIYGHGQAAHNQAYEGYGNGYGNGYGRGYGGYGGYGY